MAETKGFQSNLEDKKTLYEFLTLNKNKRIIHMEGVDFEDNVFFDHTTFALTSNGIEYSCALWLNRLNDKNGILPIPLSDLEQVVGNNISHHIVRRNLLNDGYKKDEEIARIYNRNGFVTGAEYQIDSDSVSVGIHFGTQANSSSEGSCLFSPRKSLSDYNVFEKDITTYTRIVEATVNGIYKLKGQSPPDLKLIWP